MDRQVLMLRGRDGAQLQDGVPSFCKESQEVNKGSLVSLVLSQSFTRCVCPQGGVSAPVH